MRIVFDTNVLIAAFVARGVCRELFEHCFRFHTPIVSDFILDEFVSTLRRKFDIPLHEVKSAQRLIIEQALLVRPPTVLQRVCRDPDDDNILAAALSGQAKCLITGDNDLLILKNYQRVDIIRPGDFWKYEAQQ
ncbi:MAG TPA: putative toxin-antitoxin system toxin component, PIN family [Bacteroidota bacterium]